MARSNTAQVPFIEIKLDANTDTVRLIVCGIEEVVSQLKVAHAKAFANKHEGAFANLLDLTERCLSNDNELPTGFRLALRAVVGNEWKKPFRHLKRTIAKWRPAIRRRDERPIPAIWDAEESTRAWAKEESEERQSKDRVREQAELQSIEDSFFVVIQMLSLISENAERALLGQQPVRPRRRNGRAPSETDRVLTEDYIRNEKFVEFLRHAIEEGSQIAHRLARQLYGRNKVAIRLGLAQGSVSKSEVYRRIRDQLRLRDKLGQRTCIGFDIAADDAAVSEELSAETHLLLSRIQSLVDGNQLDEATGDAMRSFAATGGDVQVEIEEMLEKVERGVNPF